MHIYHRYYSKLLKIVIVWCVSEYKHYSLFTEILIFCYKK